ncbi:hypothetical protein B0H14DRAFT_3535342 [Mycena olivaceomarginata]|nr:hypothetical protein B0H14DRAFT_3535342 [Mycena olivaceomarginata]
MSGIHPRFALAGGCRVKIASLHMRLMYSGYGPGRFISLSNPVRYCPSLPTPNSASPLPSPPHSRNPAISHADTVPEVARHSRSGAYDIPHHHPRPYAHRLHARSTHTGDTMCAVDRTHSDHVGISIPGITSRAAHLQYLARMSPLHRGGLTTSSTPARSPLPPRFSYRGDLHLPARHFDAT